MLYGAGLIDIDLEAWNAAWDYTMSGGHYDEWQSIMNLSLALARRHNLAVKNKTKLEALAKKEFEAAGAAYLSTVLQTIREERPLLKLGLYRYPMNDYEGQGYDGSAVQRARMKTVNDALFVSATVSHAC